MSPLRIINEIDNGYVHVRDTDKEIFGRAIFALDHPFNYESPDKKLKVNIPQDFETDFASIPFLFWWFFPPTGKWKRCAVVHDYLYNTGETTRKVADSVFWKERHLAPFRMSFIWLAVRLFGWLFYCKSKRIQERKKYSTIEKENEDLRKCKN